MQTKLTKYTQDWTAYNNAQMKEKIILIKLLDELLTYTQFPKRNKTGRKPFPLRDKIFYLTLQAYNIKSSRRCIADIELCRQAGYVQKTPHFNTVLKCLNDKELEVYLKHLINISGLPLKQIEKDFAVDSSGFSTSMFGRWHNERWGRIQEKERIWRKAHIMCGVKTNVITAINITSKTGADIAQFEQLLKRTDNVFDIKEVSADKAYSSRNNFNLIEDIGAVPYIDFKKNVTGRSKGSLMWRRMFYYYTKHREEFMQHYHKRSNVETCFYMVKKKFGNYLRGRSEVSQNNEILAKFLAHNLCVLVQEMFELKVNVDFRLCAERLVAYD